MARRVVQCSAGCTAAGDRISQLPLEILGHIMGLLPIYEAAKTAILSKSLRDAWLSLSRLSFDERFFSYLNKNYRRARLDMRKSPLFDVIEKVILQHMGSIREFVFAFSFRERRTIRSRSDDMDRWLRLITQQGVEEIHLRFGHHEYMLPDSIFSCSTLRRLHLIWLCVTPRCFSYSLPNVTSIHFEYVEFGPREYSIHPVDVPKLENLSFIACWNIFNCDITLRNLRSLKIKGCSSNPSRLQLCNVSAFNFDLTSICYLELANKELREYTIKRLLLQLPSLNVELFKLSDFCYYHDDWLSAFACLLCKCPKLCNIEIGYECEWLRDSRRSIDATSKNLIQFRSALQAHKMHLSLKLRDFAGLRSQMAFIQDILACVPALEKLTIVHYPYRFDWNKKHEIMERISHFPCASAKAKIVYQ